MPIVDNSRSVVKITPSWVNGLKLPECQRQRNITAKVSQLALLLARNGGHIPGTVTIATINGRKVKYILDGQHRLQAFLMAHREVGWANIRRIAVDNDAELGIEFEQLNSQLVHMRPDDKLRALERSHPGLTLIRKECTFVGYDSLRRNEMSPIVSMSLVLRAWVASQYEVPRSIGAITILAQQLTEKDAEQMVQFLGMCFDAWGRDPEYQRLWGSLNLTLAAWLWRRLSEPSARSRATSMTAGQFRKCLMSLSADGVYLDWLVGRNLTDRDRAPCYGKIVAILKKRYHQDTGKRPIVPAPPWSKGHVRGEMAVR